MTTCVTKNAYLIYKFTNPSIPDGARVQVRTTGLGQKRDSENGIRKTGFGKRDSENKTGFGKRDWSSGGKTGLGKRD